MSKKIPIQSAGVFLINKENKILIGHPTNHPKNVWSIPKGKVDEDEDLFQAALRECWEETNVELRGKVLSFDVLDPQPYDTTRDGKVKPINKVLTAIVVKEEDNKKHIDFDSFVLKCNSFVPKTASWNPGLPEMDDFKWVTLEEAKDLLHYSQVRCFKHL